MGTFTEAIVFRDCFFSVEHLRSERDTVVSTQSCVPQPRQAVEPAASEVLLKSGVRKETAICNHSLGVFAGRTKPGQHVSHLSSVHIWIYCLSTLHTAPFTLLIWVVLPSPGRNPPMLAVGSSWSSSWPRPSHMPSLSQLLLRPAADS